MLELPDPLTPSDCDLRGLEWMPLYGDRLFASDTWLMASSEGRCAAMILWWASWKQRPAGSLADNDRSLAQMAGYGMAVKSWMSIKDEAMRGWIKCSDGRLYHPVVCMFALEAWDRRKKERARKANYRSKQTGTEPGQSAEGDGDKHRDGHVEKKRQDRTGQEKEKKDSDLRSGADAPPDARAILWQQGLPIVRSLIGQSESQARGLLGKLLKVSRDNCAETLRVILEAQSLRPVNPQAWLLKAAIPAGERDLLAPRPPGESFLPTVSNGL